MSDIVERAKAALEGVTEGPWYSTGGVVWFVDVIAVPDPSDPSGQTSMPEQVQEKVCDTSEGDAEFIAASRQLVPELVAEVERLRAEIERLRNVVVDAAISQHREALKGMPDD